MKTKRILSAIFIVLGALFFLGAPALAAAPGAAVLDAAATGAAGAEPTPAPPSPGPPSPGEAEQGGMMPQPDPLAKPTMPANPVEADLGAEVYYYVCMACHGDRGQGLSPEWLAAWGLDPKGCWESRCHASNHPPEGFVLPKYIPPVVSPVILARFANALELHDYLQAEMPWHAPGSLRDEEYWQLTAFLSRANGIDPGRQPLDETRAAALSFKTVPFPEVEQPAAWGWVAGALLFAIFCAVLVVIAVKWKRTAGMNVLDLE